MKASIVALAALAALVSGARHAHDVERRHAHGGLHSRTTKEPKQLGRSDGEHWAMTYTPYGGDGHGKTWCKQPAEITKEVGEIAKKNFTTVRIYSTDDCDQLSAVHKATKQHGLGLIVGIFFKDAGAAQQDLRSQLSVITGYFGGKYDNVELITVGNECISAGSCQAGALPGLVSAAKATLSGAGYTGPVSTALIVSDWEANAAALCPVVDLVAAQVHPFFSERAIAPSAAGPYFDEQFELAQQACGGKKPVVCSETGWPRAGGAFKGQSAGEAQQAAAIASIRKSKYAGKTTFFANADDLWKSDQEEFEMYFGCLDQF